jgi:hypothetical protein
MMNIVRSTEAYESWLREQLGDELAEKDLERKHEKMASGRFPFLRATYWRWAETIFDVCPDLANAPSVLAVGDIHLENFGTWRDADGRLVWGVNDFDETAEMPYTVDLVRLATSAMLADEDGSRKSNDTCDAIVEGYEKGLSLPRAVVLERDYEWLRDLVEVKDKARRKFWSDMKELKPAEAGPPPRYARALAAAMPEQGIKLQILPRQAGAGSLGRPRWVAIGRWRGAPVVREAKVLVPSAWSLVKGRGGFAIRWNEICTGRYRAPDPWYRLTDNIVVRRLSPNNRKIEAKKDKDRAVLLGTEMLCAMGRELASIHLGTVDRRREVGRDLARRRQPWLREATGAAVDAVTKDFKQWSRRRGGKKS